MTAMGETVSVPTQVRVAGILIADGWVLMESMADRELWGVPGGRLEDGESLMGACEREYREELDLAVVPHRLALVTDHFYVDSEGHDNHVLCFYFAVSTNLRSTPELRSNESQLQFRWLELANLASHEVIPQHLYQLLPAAAVADTTLYAFDDERVGKIEIV